MKERVCFSDNQGLVLGMESFAHLHESIAQILEMGRFLYMLIPSSPLSASCELIHMNLPDAPQGIVWALVEITVEFLDSSTEKWWEFGFTISIWLFANDFEKK